MPALTNHFDVEQLFVDYPADWSGEPLPISPGESETTGVVRLSTRGHVKIRIAQIQPGSRWYGNADGHDLANMCALVAARHEAILRADFVTISRVRLAEVEHEDGHWHFLTLASASSSAKRPVAQIKVAVVCPVRTWSAQRATIMAILESIELFSGGA